MPDQKPSGGEALVNLSHTHPAMDTCIRMKDSDIC